MPTGPIVTAGPVYGYAPAQPARRGLFGRLRSRNTAYYSSGTTVPMMTVPTNQMPMTPGTPMPMPMPGVKPAGGVMMTGSVVQAGGMMPVPATGNLPPGIYTTTDGTVVQIGGTRKWVCR